MALSLRLNYQSILTRPKFGGQGALTINSHQKKFQANWLNGLGKQNRY